MRSRDPSSNRATREVARKLSLSNADYRNVVLGTTTASGEWHVYTASQDETAERLRLTSATAVTLGTVSARWEVFVVKRGADGIDETFTGFTTQVRSMSAFEPQTYWEPSSGVPLAQQDAVFLKLTLTGVAPTLTDLSAELQLQGQVT